MRSWRLRWRRKAPTTRSRRSWCGRHPLLTRLHVSSCPCAQQQDEITQHVRGVVPRSGQPPGALAAALAGRPVAQSAPSCGWSTLQKALGRVHAQRWRAAAEASIACGLLLLWQVGRGTELSRGCSLHVSRLISRLSACCVQVEHLQETMSADATTIQQLQAQLGDAQAIIDSFEEQAANQVH